jgi:nucleotidyltransferase AbiEii toxin of type IV toxin-antitoxin system
VQAHGFLDRPSEDVDLFTTTAAEPQFPSAVAAVIHAYEDNGLEVAVAISNPGFARLQVTDPNTATTAKVELGIDWRQRPPATLAIGPVLHPDDAVANKVCALYSRAQARDYIDVDAVLRSGRYSGNDLIALAAAHDPGFDNNMFVTALRAIGRLPQAEFEAYGMTDADVIPLKNRITKWADDLALRA